MYSTTNAVSGGASRGTSSHALIGVPPWPGNVTSNTAAWRSGGSTGTNSGAPPNARAAASSPAQNALKSAGSATSGRYSRSWSSGRSTNIRRRLCDDSRQRAVEAHFAPRAGEDEPQHGPDVGARRAHAQLDLARVHDPGAVATGVRGEVGVQRQREGAGRRRREIDPRGGDELLHRPRDLGDRVVQVHLHDLARRDAGVVA